MEVRQELKDMVQIQICTTADSHLNLHSVFLTATVTGALHKVVTRFRAKIMVPLLQAHLTVVWLKQYSLLPKNSKTRDNLIVIV